ncbi:MAG: hypothetical protein IKK27_10125 [Alistipes sp.]|nr:hypothetical protein [Alistipes sp.]
MNVDIFTACDNVQTYDGKLVITGTFRQLSGIGKLGNLGVAVSLSYDSEEKEKHTFSIEFIGPDGGKFANNIQGEYEAASYINISINVRDVEFKQRGKHYINLLIDDRLEKGIYIIVR